MLLFVGQSLRNTDRPDQNPPAQQLPYPVVCKLFRLSCGVHRSIKEDYAHQEYDPEQIPSGSGHQAEASFSPLTLAETLLLCLLPPSAGKVNKGF